MKFCTFMSTFFSKMFCLLLPIIQSSAWLLFLCTICSSSLKSSWQLRGFFFFFGIQVSITLVLLWSKVSSVAAVVNINVLAGDKVSLIAGLCPCLFERRFLLYGVCICRFLPAKHAFQIYTRLPLGESVSLHACLSLCYPVMNQQIFRVFPISDLASVETGSKLTATLHRVMDGTALSHIP